MKIQHIPLQGVTDPSTRDALDVLQRNLNAMADALAAQGIDLTKQQHQVNAIPAEIDRRTATAVKSIPEPEPPPPPEALDLRQTTTNAFAIAVKADGPQSSTGTHSAISRWLHVKVGDSMKYIPLYDP